MHTGARAFAHGVQAGQGRAAVLVRHDAADHVVRRRGHRDQVAARVEARVREPLRDVREARRVDAAHVEEDPSPGAQARVDRTRNRVSWSQLVDEPLTGGIDQHRRPPRARPLSPGTRRARRRAATRSGGTASARGRPAPRPPPARGTGPRRPLRSGWSCGSQRGGAARTQHRGARADRRRVRHDAGAAAVVDPQRRRGAALVHVDARVIGDQLGQARGQVAAGRAAAGVDHPAPVVAALQRQVQRAVRERSKAMPRCSRSRTRSGASRQRI